VLVLVLVAEREARRRQLAALESVVVPVARPLERVTAPTVGPRLAAGAPMQP
jgi:hypothetical protein